MPITDEMTKVKAFLNAHWLTVKDLPDTTEDERVYTAPNKDATADVLSWMSHYMDKPVQVLYDKMTERRRLIQGSVNLYPNQKRRSAAAYAYQLLQEAIDDALNPPHYRLLVSNVGEFAPEDPTDYEEAEHLFQLYKDAGYGQVTLWSSKDPDPIEEYENPDAVDGKN